MYSRWQSSPYNLELYHHGILGMKWGVRRFQNKDGSLTPAGRKRYINEDGTLTVSAKKRLDKIYKNKDKGDFVEGIKRDAARVQERSELKKAAGIVEKDEYDIIKKGSTLGRMTSTDEAIDERPKYAFLTKDDETRYSEYAMEGMLGSNAPAYMKMELSAVKDIKVAKGREVVNYLLDNYGDANDLKAIKTHKQMMELYPGLDGGKIISNKKNRMDRGFVDNLKSGEATVHTLANKAFVKDKSVRDKTFEYFRKLGYDAIVDVEDSFILDSYHGSDYPVILLNPKQSVKKKTISAI